MPSHRGRLRIPAEKLNEMPGDFGAVAGSVGHGRFSKVARQCAVEQVDYQHYLLRITELELLDRERRATERRIRQAKFPVVKTMDSFDFLAIPSLNKTLVLELARCEFLARRQNVLLLGNSDPVSFCTTWPHH
jgi:DNA replication protein DnaC